jgi:hypothetical protein
MYLISNEKEILYRPPITVYISAFVEKINNILPSPLVFLGIICVAIIYIPPIYTLYHFIL